MKALLVSMPFAFAHSPSLGLSLLKAGLLRQGFECEIRYLQLPFARQLGKQQYFHIAQAAPRALLGEWLFARALFAERLPAEREYLEQIIDSNPDDFQSGFAARLPGLRREAEAYLQRCLEAVDWKAADVIGFTSTFAQNLASLALAQRIKQAYPEKIIIFGGANCEGEMGLELHRQFPFIDYVCSGEADLLLPRLLQRLQAGRPVETLPGLVYRRDGESRANGLTAPAVFDLDALPLPDFDDYFEQLAASGLEFGPGELRLPVETSRGCWWGWRSHCAFCGLNDDLLVYRSKSSERALAEFAHIAQRYPQARLVDAVDKILDMRYFERLIPELAERRLGLNIFYFVKANLSKAQLRQLKAAGIQRLQPGIESLDTDALLRMHKGSSALQNLQLLKWSAEVGLDIIWNFLTGLPGEDPRTYTRMAQMLPLISHLQPPAGAPGRVRLDRFSPYFTDPAAFGMENIRPAAGYRFVYPFDQASLSRLAYFFDFDYADRRQPRQYTAPLDRAVADWAGLEAPGVLLSLDNPRGLVLYDTRPARRQDQYALTGLARSIYELCDEAHSLAGILRRLGRPGGEVLSAADVQPVLDWLVEAGLMLHLDGRYLSLALAMDRPAQPFIDLFVKQFAPGPVP